MDLIFEGVNITDKVSITSASITDCAGGRADILEVAFADTQGLWSKWKPQKGNVIELKQEGFTSGLMHLDQQRQIQGSYIVEAISTPVNAKSNRSRSWNQVRFQKLASDVAANLGLGLKFEAVDQFYEWIWQNDETDLEFLNKLAKREGFMLKIFNGQILLYDERQLEKTATKLKISPSDCIGPWSYLDTANGKKSACTIAYIGLDGKLTSYTFRTPEAIGAELKIKDIRLSSIAEAERWSKGFLRQANKNLQSFKCAVRFNHGIAAGSTVECGDFGLTDGNYYVEKAVHNLTGNVTRLEMRRPLEGY